MYLLAVLIGGGGGGGWEREWFSSGIPQYSPSRTFGLGTSRQDFTYRPFGKLLN